MKSNAAKGGALGAVMLIALPFVADQEGLRHRAYLDAVGIPTICYGETEGVKMGQVKTSEECRNMLNIRLAWYATQVDAAVVPDMTPERHAALASFTYNVGVGAFKSSTLLRKLNAGDVEGACNELLRWDKAKGKVLRGLTIRREKERQLCLQ